MSHDDPLDGIEDHPIDVTPTMIDALKRLRATRKLDGDSPLSPEEIEMLEPMLDASMQIVDVESSDGLIAHYLQ